MMHVHIGVAKQCIYQASAAVGKVRACLRAGKIDDAEHALRKITHAHGAIHQSLDAIEGWYKDEHVSHVRSVATGPASPVEK